MGEVVAVSQRRAVLSAPPVSMVLPSGLNATHRTGPRCTRRPPMGRPVDALHSRAAVLGPGQNGLTVRAQSHGPDRLRMQERRPQRIAGPRIQQPNRVAGTPVNRALPPRLDATETESPR